MKRATFLKASLISKGIIATCAIVGFLMHDDASRVAWTSLLHEPIESTRWIVYGVLAIEIPQRRPFGVRWTFD